MFRVLSYICSVMSWIFSLAMCFGMRRDMSPSQYANKSLCHNVAVGAGLGIELDFLAASGRGEVSPIPDYHWQHESKHSEPEQCPTSA